MLRKISFPLFVIFALSMLGCSKTEMTNNTNSSAANTNKAATSSNTSTGTTSSTTGTGEKIGVPDCDDFIAKYDACVSGKVPKSARAQYKTAIATWRESWKKAAANPTTKAALASQCKQIAEQQKTALKMYGCEF